MDTATLLARVPDYREFATLEEVSQRNDELASDFPGLVRRETVGRSAEGRPIDLLTVGHGRRSVLIVGVPHPNEPIGLLTSEFLCRLLCEDEGLRTALDVTLHVVPVADPDGLALNEGWLKGDLSPARYALGFYRPPHREQVEWSFPLDYKSVRFSTPSPEAATLMRVMERTRPGWFYSLHNATLGGVYFYVSGERPGLFAALQRLVAEHELPLHRGEPEVPYLRRLSAGIFGLFGAEDTYEYLARTLGVDPAPHIEAGTCADDWLKRVSDAFAFVCEVPCFSTPLLADETPTGCRRRDALREGITEERRLVEETGRLFASLGGSPPEHRLTRSVQDYLARAPALLDADLADLDGAVYDRDATRAELVDATVSRLYRHLPYRGQVLRIAGLMGVAVRVAQHREALVDGVETLCQRSAIEPLPLQKLVAVQAGTALLALDGEGAV